MQPKYITEYSPKVRAQQLVCALVVMLCLLVSASLSHRTEIVYDHYQGYVSNSDVQYYVTRYTLWNPGRSTISRDEVTDPLVVSMHDVANVFFAQITETSNKQTGFQSQFVRDSGQVRVTFDTLNPRDSAVLSIYHHAPIKTNIRGSLSNGRVLQPEKNIPLVLLIPFSLYTGILLACMLGQLILLLVRRIQRRQEKPQWYFPNPVLLLDRRRIENHDPRKRSRFALWFYRNWPLTQLIIWLVCYPLVFLMF